MGEEKKLRDQCSRWLKSQGGLMLPLRGWLRGTPDALVVNAGKIHLVEFKAINGKLSASQIVLSNRIAKAGCVVVVVRTIEQFKKMLT